MKTVLALAAIFGCCYFASAESQVECLKDVGDLTAEDSTDLSDIADFGITLFKEVFPYKETRNFFYSPYSIWNALTLAYFGAKGNTEKELRKALGVQDKIATLKKWRANEFMYKMRQLNNTKFTFRIANRAYFDKAVKLNSCVEKILSNELRVTDMSKGQKVAIEVNKWVSEVTKGGIKKLLKPSDVTNSNMILTNAAFFKGTWQYQFKKSKTQKDLFYSSPQNFSIVNMMTQKGSFRVGKSDDLGAQILELPYSGGSISMIILLPPFISGDQGFDAMVGRLNSTTLSRALDMLWRREVEVSIPKFKLEESIGDDLIKALQVMGVRDVFDASLSNLTDFSEMDRLSISKGVHKAFVEVSEEGTEAGAATAFIGFRSARPVGPSKFKCNYPFMFLIYDNDNKNILFMGAYKSPRDRKSVV